MKATLTSHSQPGMYAKWSLDHLRRAKQEAATIIRRARLLGAKYLERSKTRGYTVGYFDGISAARDATNSLIDRWGAAIDALQHSTRDEIHTMALELAMKIVERELSKETAPYARWLHEALEMVKETQTLYLRHAPAHATLFKALLENSPQRITLVEDPSLEESEIFLHTKRGRIGFGWKDALQAAVASSSEDSV